MAKMVIVGTTRYTDPQLGRIRLTVRSNARRIIARLNDGIVSITIPPGMTPDEYEKSLDSMRPGILEMQQRAASRPVPFHVGQHIVYDGFTIDIIHDPRMCYGARTQHLGDEHYAIYVNDKDVSDLSGLVKTIRLVMDDLAGYLWPKHILPLANSEADRLGLVAIFKPGRGKQRLGLCTSEGIITLSRQLVYMPYKERRYVICHELAHLTHMDHSPAFHALVERYLADNSVR